MVDMYILIQVVYRVLLELPVGPEYKERTEQGLVVLCILLGYTLI